MRVVCLLMLLTGTSALAQETPIDQYPAKAPLKVELGRYLFFDRRLSADNSTSCADCHQEERGWADGRKTAQGMAQHFVGPRNTPTVLGAAFKRFQFLDGRADGLRQQTTLPLVNPIEMGNVSQRQVVDRLNGIAGYRALFEEAFAELATQDHIAESLETFTGRLTSRDAPIDRFLDGDHKALTPPAQRGYSIFSENCVRCHQPPFYRDDKAHNTGVAFRFGTQDEGRFKVDNTTPKNTRAFMTPTLREIWATAPYTHRGDIKVLEDVVAHYARGGATRKGHRDEYIDPGVAQIRLNKIQQRDLVVFLNEAFKGDYPRTGPPVEFPH